MMIMKKSYFALVAALSVLLAVPVFAGEYTQTTTQAPPSACGTGWYFGLGGGVNLYQDFGDQRNVSVNGTQFELDTNDHVGGFGGIKFGYVFGTGTWRFGLEEDWFYNGVNATATLDLNGGEISSASGLFNTGAFMT